MENKSWPWCYEWKRMKINFKKKSEKWRWVIAFFTGAANDTTIQEASSRCCRSKMLTSAGWDGGRTKNISGPHLSPSSVWGGSPQTKSQTHTHRWQGPNPSNPGNLPRGVSLGGLMGALTHTDASPPLTHLPLPPSLPLPSFCSIHYYFPPQWKQGGWKWHSLTPASAHATRKWDTNRDEWGAGSFCVCVCVIGIVLKGKGMSLPSGNTVC